jgi:hypothetical protein
MLDEGSAKAALPALAGGASRAHIEIGEMALSNSDF